ncbi:MAG: hypothetical protein IIX03_03745 [Paludibacteraceae bacterium]|nr:hypothetical protein [Paludibacteraceae bacterium]
MQNDKASNRFLLRYNPDSRIQILTNPTLAFHHTTDNPTIHRVEEVYGFGVVEEWVTCQMFRTLGRCGFDCVNGADDIYQLISDNLRTRYRHLTLREFMLFLCQFERGEFGDFSRIFNSQKFFTALNQFMQYRSEQRHKIQLAIEAQHQRELSNRRAQLYQQLLPHYPNNPEALHQAFALECQKQNL